MKNAYFLLIAWLLCSHTLFSQADSCPDSTWIKLLGQPDNTEIGGTLCPVGDGNLYVTGSIKDSAVILKIAPDGQILWARSFNLFPGYPTGISHLRLDSNGMFIGCARTGFNGGYSSCYFKYDPQQDELLWAWRPSPYTVYSGYVAGIWDKYPGGNYLINFSSVVPPYEAVIMEIGRQTGQKIAGTSWRYTWNSSVARFAAVVLRDSLIYATSDVNVNINSVIPGLICISASDGQPKWSQKSPFPPTDIAFLSAKDLIVDDDAIVSTFHGDKGYSAQSFVFLQKTTLDGDILWVKKYDLTDFFSEQVNKIVRVNDGYVMLGTGLGYVGGYGLFILKTDFDGNVLWTRRSASSAPAGIELNNFYENGLIEMDGFLYFTGYSTTPSGSRDWLLAKVDSEGLADNSCTYLTFTPVVTSILNPVQEHPPLSFRNEDIESILPVPISKPSATDVSSYRAICEHICENEEGCDVKINDCAKFELLNISVDAGGDRHYRVRFTNSCAGQTLNYLAIQLPQGTTAVWPKEGAIFISEHGREYSVRNPNYSPFYSIRFKPQGAGSGSGESDVFEYVLPPQAQPTYINVLARFQSGQFYEAHLNVFNCPVQAQSVENRDSDLVSQVSIAPNPVTDVLTVTLPEAGEGHWRIFGSDGREMRAGKWSTGESFTIPTFDLPSGVYFLRLTWDELNMVVSKRFIK